MGFSCGIVGLPNVGKSTLFNAITKSTVEAANYPFCTIEPNQGIVAVPDERLTLLERTFESKKRVPTTVEFTDIAGLVRGAHKGEGLGNQFLSHIRQVDAICEVVRVFDDSQVTRDGAVDPVGDIEIIHTELILADLETVQKRLLTVEKAVRSGDKEAKLKKDILDRLVEHLGQGKLANRLSLTPAEHRAAVQDLHLLTGKPFLIVANIGEKELHDYENNPKYKALASWAAAQDIGVVALSAKFESELSELADVDEASAKEFLAMAGYSEPGLHRLIRSGYGLLNLITFFTAGETETRAWTVRRGALAPEAAGVIHSDFEKGFIKAEIVSYKDIEELGSYAKCRESGKIRIEGKNYEMKDGDICHFRFNV